MAYTCNPISQEAKAKELADTVSKVLGIQFSDKAPLSSMLSMGGRVKVATALYRSCKHLL